MASASRPVGVRLWETCKAAGSTPAPVRASVTCAVAGLGDPAASRPRASVTVFLTVSVAAAGPSVSCPPVVPANGPAGASDDPGPVDEAALGDAAVGAAAVAGSAAPGWAPGTPPTQPDKRATSAAAVMAASTRCAARGREAEGAAEDAPALLFCRWSGLVRMLSFCHVVRRPFTAWAGRARPGGVPRPCPPRDPRGTLIQEIP